MKKKMSYLVLGMFVAMTIGAMTNPLTYVEKMFAPANNFVNPGFEANDSGVCLGDASGAAPTTDQSCSASPSLTKAFETTNPLSGLRSLKISKAAANQQGEFIAIDFTIDRDQREKSNTLEFQLEATANFVFGTVDGSTAGDIRVFIADKTTSVVTAPYPNNLQANGKYVGQWQASANRTYQLILWIPTTTSLAWDLTLDSFRNRLSDWVVINSDSDWVSYTPATAQQGFGNISAVTAKYRKLGPDMEVEIRFTTGTHSGSDARFAFPTGLVSASDYPSGENQLVGTYTYNGAAYGFTVLMQPSVSYFTFGSGISGNGYTVRTGSNITGSTSNGFFSFRAKVRIQGWTSGYATPGTVMQNVPVTFSAYKNAGSISANTTIPTWTAVRKDSVSAFNSSTGEYTVKIPGDYYFSGTLGLTANNGGTLHIKKNGTVIIMGSNESSDNRDAVSGVLPGLVPGDIITLAYGAAATCESTDYGTTFTGFKIESPFSFIVIPNTVRCTADVSTAGVVSNEDCSFGDHDWINGNGSVSSTSTYTFTLITNRFPGIVPKVLYSYLGTGDTTGRLLFNRSAPTATTITTRSIAQDTSAATSTFVLEAIFKIK